MKNTALLLMGSFITLSLFAQTGSDISKKKVDSFNNHVVILDDQSKIISWITPQSKAYDVFLRQRWNFIKTMVPNSPGPISGSSYPQYYFYCACRFKAGKPGPYTWMNDVGKKLPNWFESARFYYAYTGDTSVTTIFRNFIDYAIEHEPFRFFVAGFPIPPLMQVIRNIAGYEFKKICTS